MTIKRNLGKVTTFTATDEQGNRSKWAFWFDKGYGAWFLRDMDGYERHMEATWIDSLPRINLTLTNYGMVTRLS
jgi:hypothetical protein